MVAVGVRDHILGGRLRVTIEVAGDDGDTQHVRDAVELWLETERSTVQQWRTVYRGLRDEEKPCVYVKVEQQ